MYQTLKLRELNPFITCGICGGYLIDATTITECLHTFCRSCIVKHLQEDNICPTCKIVVHHSYPLNYISSDRTMQEIVYKLVPGLQERELQRQKEFEVAMFMYRTGEQQNAYNAMNSRKTLVDNLSPSSPCSSNEKEHEDYHRGDEQVAICMECYRANGKYSLKPLPRKYLRLSSQATVLHLKKFLAKKLCLDDHKDVDILCNDEILGKDHTLKFICVTRWRFKELTRYATSLAERKLQQLKKARACQPVTKNAYEEVIWSLDNLIKNLTKDNPHTTVCDKHRKPNRGGEFSWARTKLKLGKESET